MNQQALSSLIWSVADLLRGDFKQSEYGRVILPFTVLRRLDCVLAPTKEAALAEHASRQKAGIAFEPFVKRQTGLDFYNVSSLDMGRLMGDQDNVRACCFPRYSVAPFSSYSAPDNTCFPGLFGIGFGAAWVGPAPPPILRGVG